MDDIKKCPQCGGMMVELVPGKWECTNCSHKESND
ncbi:Hypothetical protein LUCI_2565 [Lucifera butyrica]|uniref:Uncharacterized protein n=1 Tax=Lucifera butyrica TaxID=1351585 RepID=A0A498R7G5_9FIRM|nr:Hypothetical protein LUCI_2565 [Lucifera butyrica]